VLLAVVQVLEECALDVVIVIEGPAASKQRDERLDDADVASLRRMTHDTQVVVGGECAKETKNHRILPSGICR
jgi:hypothetical protein